MSRNYGLTLLELLASLLIISILCMFCVPLGLSVYENNQLQVVGDEISTAIRFARNMALLHQLPLALTPLNQSNDWSEGMVLFVDNKKHRLTEHDKLIQQWNWQRRGVKVSWQGFQTNDYLLFPTELHHAALSGHFDLQNREGRVVKLVINRLGRVTRVQARPHMPLQRSSTGG